METVFLKWLLNTENMQCPKWVRPGEPNNIFLYIYNQISKLLASVSMWQLHDNANFFVLAGGLVAYNLN